MKFLREIALYFGNFTEKIFREKGAHSCSPPQEPSPPVCCGKGFSAVLHYYVTGMRCQSCVSRIELTLREKEVFPRHLFQVRLTKWCPAATGTAEEGIPMTTIKLLFRGPSRTK